MHKVTLTLKILLLHVLKSAVPGRCNLVVLFKCGRHYSEGESASGEPLLVLDCV